MDFINILITIIICKLSFNIQINKIECVYEYNKAENEADKKYFSIKIPPLRLTPLIILWLSQKRKVPMALIQKPVFLTLNFICFLLKNLKSLALEHLQPYVNGIGILS